MTDNYYWYFHRDISNENEIVYVGIGTKDRAWYCRNRQPDHLEWLNQIDKLFITMDEIVEIGDRGLSRKEALETEIQLINEYKPRFNRNFRLNDVCKLSKEDFDLAIELRKEGMIYKEIAKELNVSTMTIHRALSGGTKKYEQYKE